MNQAPLVLASSSPQRSRLLTQMGLEFDVRPVSCNEDLTQEADADRLVELICRQKMAAAHEQLDAPTVAGAWILTSDTLVSLDHHRLGKPENRAEAERFMKLLSGRTHQVLTGICLSEPRLGLPPAVHYDCSTSNVRFRTFTEQDISWYLDSLEWQEAAGGYRIQGRGACLVESITGSHTGIIGLPLELLYGMLCIHRFL